MTERSMLKREQEVADERVAIGMSRAEHRQEQHSTAAKATAEALKLLQSEQGIPCAGATFLVTEGGNVAQEVQPQDVVITSGPNLPVQSRVQQVAR